jgi:hypothetical protein
VAEAAAVAAAAAEAAAVAAAAAAWPPWAIPGHSWATGGDVFGPPPRREGDLLVRLPGPTAALSFPTCSLWPGMHRGRGLLARVPACLPPTVATHAAYLPAPAGAKHCGAIC